MTPRLVVIGAGPVGVVAALRAIDRGFEVTVLEAGQVGTSLRGWGPTRFFTPFAMNLPADIRALLADAPPADAILTGPEMATRVLEPLAQSTALKGRILTDHRVRAIGRARMLRTELSGHPLRAERLFRLLVDTPDGERTLEAERVLDASGTYGQPLALGAGGLPARNERRLSPRIVRDLGRFHERSSQLAGRRILLVGHGHSAANALSVLSELAHTHPDTRLTWAVRSSNGRPCVEVADDSLPERRLIVARANDLAQHPPQYLRVERRAQVESLERTGESVAVTLSDNRVISVDEIVSLTGYRPDLSILSELAIEISPHTEGAQRLERAVGSVTDCLAVPRVTTSDLTSGEPGFHLVGHKSYGRASTFLLSTGYAHLETLMTQL